MTIREIAAAAGVSPSTVSKVINRKDKDISDATRQKVLDVIQRYQYHPYKEAIKLNGEKTHLIAVLVMRGKEEYYELLESIEAQLTAFGYNMLFTIIDTDKDKCIRQAKILCSQRVEAVISINEYYRDELRASFSAHNIPFLVLTDNTAIQSFMIESGLNRAAAVATEFLLKKGHQKIIALCQKGNEAWTAACRKAMTQKNLNYDLVRSADDLSSELSAWLPLDCTAVICQTTALGVQLCRRLELSGFHVPQDISIIILEDNTYAKQAFPSLTAVQRPWQNIAFDLVNKAVRYIEGRIRNLKHPMQQHQIIERQSTAAPPDNRRGHKLLVVGSLNIDVNISLSHIPNAGENIQASSVTLVPGGKGTNQAVGAARLGADVYIIGCLGKDASARSIYDTLQLEHVHSEGVIFDSIMDTGKAYINIADDGKSSIVIYSGANGRLDTAWLDANKKIFKGVRYCLLSTEIPMKTVLHTLDICEELNIPVILKPAGISDFPLEYMKKIAYLIAKKRELNNILPGSESIEEKAAKLLGYGCNNVIITLGKDGCYLKNVLQDDFFPAMDVEAVDTTGGADAFISALAVYLSEGVSLSEAIGFATYSAGICVAGKGVQAVLAHRGRLDMYRNEIEKIYARGSVKNE